MLALSPWLYGWRWVDICFASVFSTHLPRLVVSEFVGGVPLHAMPLILLWSTLVGVRRSE